MQYLSRKSSGQLANNCYFIFDAFQKLQLETQLLSYLRAKQSGSSD